MNIRTVSNVFFCVGCPEEDENGKVIEDEFSKYPVAKQWFLRFYNKIRYYKKVKIVSLVSFISNEYFRYLGTCKVILCAQIIFKYF